VLSYVNTADMGNYREAIEQFNADKVKVPTLSPRAKKAVRNTDSS